MSPPIWVDEHGQPCPTRPCPKCGRVIPIKRVHPSAARVHQWGPWSVAVSCSPSQTAWAVIVLRVARQWCPSTALAFLGRRLKPLAEAESVPSSERALVSGSSVRRRSRPDRPAGSPRDTWSRSTEQTAREASPWWAYGKQRPCQERNRAIHARKRGNRRSRPLQLCRRQMQLEAYEKWH
jgi:hypothetical protein